MLRFPARRTESFPRRTQNHSQLVRVAAEKNSKSLPVLDEALESQIWQRFDQRICAATPRVFPVYIIGFCDISASRLKTLLEELGFCSWSSSVDADELRDLGSVADRRFYVLVNAQAYEDTIELVESLISFREKYGEAIVVLISEDVSSDDLGAERSAISDATLRAPIDRARLSSGLSSAFENNRALKIKKLQMGLL
jgi:hypothetical protein